MATDVSVPVNISVPASARVAELGMQREFDEIVDYARQTAPDLRFIEVTLEHDSVESRPPLVTLWVHRAEPDWGDDPTDRSWAAWLPRALPPEVCEHFVMLSFYEPRHEG
jgi:hypothetical protein